MTRPRKKQVAPAPPVAAPLPVPIIPEQDASLFHKHYDKEQPDPRWRHPFFVEEDRSPLPVLWDSAGYPVILFDPVPRRRKRADGWCERTQRAFIAQLARTPQVTRAAKAVGRNVRSAYQLLKHPEAEQFAKAWDMAMQFGRGRLTDTALGVSLDGPEEVPVMRGGRLVRTERRFNHKLAIALITGRGREHAFRLRDAQTRWASRLEWEMKDNAEAAAAKAREEAAAEYRRQLDEFIAANPRPRPVPRIRFL